MVRTERDRAYRPSALGNNSRIREFTPIKFNSKYKFSKPVYRITYENQIKLVFDNPDKVEVNGGQYRGRIDGIEARIDFSLNRPCLLNTKTEEELTNTHKKILDRLLGRNGESSKN